MEGTFMILVEFLERLGPSAVANYGPVDTFNFLARRCPQGHGPPLFQHRFATWLLELTNQLSRDSVMVEAITEWFFNASSEYFNDIVARQKIGQALGNYLGVLSHDQSWPKQKINTVIAQLKSPPDIAFDGHTGTKVSSDDHATRPGSDTSSQSSRDGALYHTPSTSAQS